MPATRSRHRSAELRAVGALAVAAAIGLGACSSKGATTTEASDPKAAVTTTTTEPSAPAPPVTAATAEAPSFTMGLPEGWEQAEANDISDLYVKHATDPDVELAVRSSPIAGGAPALEEYVTTQHDTLGDYTNTDEVTDPAELDAEVDGEPATYLDWTFSADGADGEEISFQHRRVFVVHAGELYDLTFQAPAEDFDELAEDLDTMLATWAFA